MPEPPNADLNQIAAPAVEQVSNEPDPSTENEILEQQVEGLRLENQSLKQDIDERRKYAHRIFCLISTWLIAVFVLLAVQGFNLLSFRLSDSVLLAVVGSTTVNVLGIFYIVANYLFPKR